MISFNIFNKITFEKLQYDEKATKAKFQILAHKSYDFAIKMFFLHFKLKVSTAITINYGFIIGQYTLGGSKGIQHRYMILVYFVSSFLSSFSTQKCIENVRIFLTSKKKV